MATILIYASHSRCYAVDCLRIVGRQRFYLQLLWPLSSAEVIITSRGTGSPFFIDLVAFLNRHAALTSEHASKS